MKDLTYADSNLVVPIPREYARVVTGAAALKESVDRTSSCRERCFSDPLLLARCEGCRDELASAAMDYLQAVRDFRKGVQSETGKPRRARRAG